MYKQLNVSPCSAASVSPTVCCQDETVLVRDKVAIILSALLFPAVILNLKESLDVWEFLCYTCPGAPAQVGGGTTL